MSMTDPISDLFVRIRNGAQRGHPTVLVPASKLKGAILQVFQGEGFIRRYSKVENEGKPLYQIELRYLGGREKKSVITGIRRISKPGLRVYVPKDKVPRVIGGLGVSILSSTEGVLTGRECRQRGIGGEVLCHIW
ncbi:MAG: 30S ribosomal protein S8 [Nitrospirae bacterium]|nr:30S ribosomal protein S8 [Nitrospirota bacterium]